MTKANNNRMGLYLIPLGIAINVVIGQVVLLLHLPVFLDTIGTALVAALCGPLYSIITAAITCCLLSITSPDNLFYMGNFVFVALAAGLVAKRGYFKNFWKSLISGIVIGFLSGALAGTTTMLIFGYSATPTGIIAGVISKMFNMGMLAANIVSECCADTIDKIPTFIIAYIIIRSIPQRFLLKLPLGGQYLTTKAKTPSPS